MPTSEQHPYCGRERLGECLPDLLERINELIAQRDEARRERDAAIKRAERAERPVYDNPDDPRCIWFGPNKVRLTYEMAGRRIVGAHMGVEPTEMVYLCDSPPTPDHDAPEVKSDADE